MHPQHKSGDAVRPFWQRVAPPRASYEEEQAGILDELLDEYPALLTFDEARINRVRDREDWGESDAFEIALNGLFTAGLVRRQGDFLVPVRPVREMADLGFSIG
ncbi:MAG TPA: hypothetical protein VGH14_04330 [Solirubrobacterales bacterium]|jgi:hypothetical protein